MPNPLSHMVPHWPSRYISSRPHNTVAPYPASLKSPLEAVAIICMGTSHDHNILTILYSYRSQMIIIYKLKWYNADIHTIIALPPDTILDVLYEILLHAGYLTMLECMHEITEHVSSIPFNSSSEWKHSKHGFPRVCYRMRVPAHAHWRIPTNLTGWFRLI